MRVRDPLDQLAHVRRELARRSRAAARGRRGARVDRCDDAGRRVADAEQAALALGEHLEPHRRLVEPGLEVLELPQRRPLRLADGLARRLDPKRLARSSLRALLLA